MSDATGGASSAGSLRLELLARNPARLCLFHGLVMSLFPVAVITLFWKSAIGMSLTEIMLLQGLFGAAVALFEFPSGYLSDRFGYRRTLIAASVLMIVGWGAYSVARTFAEVLIAELVLGLGYSLISGADSALLYESLLESGRRSEFARWNGLVRFWGQTAEGTAALCAGMLYALHERAVFLAQLVVWIAATGVAWKLVEPTRNRPVGGGHVAQALSMVRHALVENRALRAVIAMTVVLQLATFIPVWLIALYAEGAGVAVGWIGPIWAVANYTVAFGALASHRLERRIGFHASLVVCVALIAVGYLGLGLSHALLGFAFYYCLTTMRGLNGPILHHREQELVPSSDRAGFLSLRSLLFRSCFLALGPLVGIAVDEHGQHPVLLVTGCALTLVCLPLWFEVRRRVHPHIAPHEGAPA